ncbi:MAG: hypothetical protein OXC69_04330 [Candidatus Tectomicrobia bacterium]|nr:hypothetical protein [Candidatus Tectomicrobia bacterium]
MDAAYLARLALARLPKPYTKEVTLHVFCEIERTPHLRKAYDKLLEKDNTYRTAGGLNSRIGNTVSTTLQATKGRQIDARDICEIVKWPSVLSNINSEWEWE